MNRIIHVNTKTYLFSTTTTTKEKENCLRPIITDDNCFNAFWSKYFTKY